MSTEKIPILKKEAIVPIELGAGFVTRLYELLAYLGDKTPEEIHEFQKLVEDKKLPDAGNWGYHYLTLTMLLQEIAKSADAKGMIDYVDLPTQDN